MKTDVTIYQADIDGTYSSVRKVSVSRSFADDVLESQNDEYFKTFSAAKKEVLKHMIEQLNYWKEAVSEVKCLKLSDLENEED